MVILLVDHYDSFSWNVHNFLYEQTCSLSPQASITQIPYDHCGEITEFLDGALEDLRLRGGSVLVVLSPGPGNPVHDVVFSRELYQAYKDRLPFWGICLGHQIIGVCEGFDVVRSSAPVHGSERWIYPGGVSCPSGFQDQIMLSHGNRAWADDSLSAGVILRSDSCFRDQHSSVHQPFKAGVYNSLCLSWPRGVGDDSEFAQRLGSGVLRDGVEPGIGGSIGANIDIIARDDQGEIAVIERSPGHGQPPILGVQFHPESFLSVGVQGPWQRFLSSVESYFSDVHLRTSAYE